VTQEQLQELGDELGIDVIGAAPASAYESTERHIRERRARGLFADMRFTTSRPEISCHPEGLIENARTVVSAAACYWFAEPERPPPPVHVDGCVR
jgi:epoxyqueuosine reductase